MKETEWKTAPISPVCQVAENTTNRWCELPTEACYPAMGGGWMSLCLKHSLKHRPYCRSVDDLIRSGEKFE